MKVSLKEVGNFLKSLCKQGGFGVVNIDESGGNVGSKGQTQKSFLQSSHSIELWGGFCIEDNGEKICCPPVANKVF